MQILYYKGCIVEYTGIHDHENPIGLRWSNQYDCPYILISASILPFLIETIAEAIINDDRQALGKILEKSGLKTKKPQLSAKLEMEIFEIAVKNGIKF